MCAAPSRTGLKSLGAAALTAFIAYVFLIHDFLAVSKPISGEVMVVESWFAGRPAAMRETAEYFAKGHYQLVLCVGGEAAPAGGIAGKSSAELAADRLVELGLDPKVIRVVAEIDVEFGRTFGSARAARDWIQRERPDLRSVDVVTLSVHARKSFILFRKAFEPERTVGVVALKETAYPPGHWWTTRTGWYIVLRNTAGYFQALFQSPDSATPK